MSSHITPLKEPQKNIFYSLLPGSSLKARITQAAFAVLAIILLAASLYGYLGDPSWLIGAHVLAGSAALSFAMAGALVLASCRRKGGLVKKRGEQPQINETPVRDIRNAFAEIFGENLPQPRNSAEYKKEKGNSTIDRTSKYFHFMEPTCLTTLWEMDDDLIYGVFPSKEGDFYALIKVCGDSESEILFYNIAPSDKGYKLEIVARQGHEYKSRQQKIFSEQDASFLKELIQNGQAGNYKLYTPV